MEKIKCIYTMGGSILPATIHNGQLYFLFGKERNIDKNPGWADFGGGTDKGENYLETAIREGSEELTGFLGDRADIRRLLARFGTFDIDYEPRQEKYSTYRVHIFPIKYDAALPHYYNNNARFLHKHLNSSLIRDSKIFEKTRIEWIPVSQFRKRIRQFRTFYRDIIQIILRRLPDIERFIRSSLVAHKSTRKSRRKMRKTRRQLKVK